MLHDIVKKGSTDRSVTVRIIAADDGTPETGVAFDTSGIDLWYRREGAAKVSITEATLAALTTAHSDGGFLHIGDGVYRLDLPDAAFATGANYVDFGGTVTDMIVIGGRVRLVDIDVEDTVRGGLTALPNAAAAASGGLFTRGTGAGQINQDANGRIDINVAAISGDATAADNLETSLDDTAGAVRWAGILDQGTAQAATSTTLRLRSAAAFADDELNGCWVVITGGSAGVGQVRQITDYVASTDTATVDAWTTTPTGTITYQVRPAALIAANVEKWLGTAAQGASGRPQVDVELIEGADPTDTIRDAVVDDATRIDASALNTAAQTTIPAILDDTDLIDDGTSGLAKIATDVAAVLVDTSTTLQGELDGIQADTEDIQTKIGTPAGASLAADIADVEGKVDDLESRVGTPSNLGGGASIAQNLADIEAQTDDIGAAGAGLTALAAAADLATLDGKVDTLDGVVDTLAARLAGLVLAQGVLGDTGNDTTHVHLVGFTYGDDEINNLLLVLFDDSTGEYHARWITDWVASTALATVATLPFTPEDEVDVYWLLPIRQDVTGGSGLDAAGVRAAIGLASANLDTQLADLPTNAELATALAAADDAVLAQVALVKAKTDNLPSDPADASVVAGLIAAVETKVDDVDTVVDAIKATTDKLDDTVEDQGGGTYGFTEAALQEAPTGEGGGGTDWDADERTAIRAILGIPGSGTTPADPSAGILDTIRDSVVLVKAKTDNLPSDPADQSALEAILGTPAGASLAADLADVEGKVDDLETRIGTPSNLGGGATVAANLADIEAQTDDIGAAGAGLTAIPDSAGVTTLLSRIPAALFGGITSLAQWLGLLAGKQAGNSTARTELRATGAGSGTFDETSDSLEAARDNQQTAAAAAITAYDPPTRTEATSDKDEVLGRLGTPAGASVSADIATRASQSSVDDLPTNAELTTALAGADDAVLAAIAALNNLSPANIRAAVGLASANLDTQLADLPTNAELAAALSAADDAVLAAIAALNNLSAAQVNAEVVDALATDTHAEPSAIPAATASLKDKIGFLAALARNTVQQTAGAQTLKNDGGSGNIGTAAVSDDGTTFERSEWV